MEQLWERGRIAAAGVASGEYGGRLSRARMVMATVMALRGLGNRRLEGQY